MDNDGFLKDLLAKQMFDPPLWEITIAGVPILHLSIPQGEYKYRNFLGWWLQVGRLHPEDPQGFATLSGPGVMRGRVDAISADDWSALSEEEQRSIAAWAAALPIHLFYD